MEPLMETFADKAQCIAMDLRGCGFSSYNKPISTIHDLSEDIHLFMRETFPMIETYYAVGHGIGATVAMSLIQNYSHQIKGLALIAPVIGKEDPRCVSHNIFKVPMNRTIRNL